MSIPRSAKGARPRAYRDQRDFHKPPSAGAGPWRRTNPIFVIQKHAASHLHYDFRLEVDGVLKSWAVPQGPSLDPRDKRLAVEVEDHDLEYADFEGVIAEGRYGAGTVIVWDAGPYRNLARDKSGNEIPAHDALARGRLEIWLEGKKIRGGYALVRTQMGGGKRNWLLIKMRDECANPDRRPTETEPYSVISGRTVEEVAPRQGQVLHFPRNGAVTPPLQPSPRGRPRF